MAPLAARDGTLDRMASFAQQLERLLLAAQARGLVESGLAAQLTALAAGRERGRGWLSLGGVVGWLVAIAPLAVLLRSPAISGLGILAAWLWLHFEAANSDSPVHVSGFTSYLMLSFGMGLALLGGQSKLRQEDRRIRSVMRGAAQLMLFYGVYLLGFFRRFAERADTVATGSLVLHLGA